MRNASRRLSPAVSWREVMGMWRQFRPEAGALAPLEQAMDRGLVSARSADRVLRLSWTVADLAGICRPRRAETGCALGCGWGIAQ